MVYIHNLFRIPHQIGHAVLEHKRLPFRNIHDAIGYCAKIYFSTGVSEVRIALHQPSSTDTVS